MQIKECVGTEIVINAGFLNVSSLEIFCKKKFFLKLILDAVFYDSKIHFDAVYRFSTTKFCRQNFDTI